MMLLTCQPYKVLFLLLSIFALQLGSTPPVYAGDPFSFSGNWTYLENGGDTGSSQQFNETYSLTYSKEMSAAMNFAGSVRYSERYLSEGADSTSLNPSMSLDVRNDLFFLNLNASQTESKRDNSPRRTNDFWGLNLNSSLEERWPSLRFYFNQSSSSDDAKPKQTDNDTTTTGGSIEYTIEPVTLLYDVRYSESTDNIDRTDSDNLDQTAMISYDQNFYQGRVSLSASQQFQKAETTTESRVGEGNTFFIDVPAVAGFYRIDNTPDTGFLDPAPGLVDGDRNSPTFIDIFATTDLQNMAVQVNSQTVTRLEVFLADELTATQQSLLTWQAYQSSDGENWTLLGGIVSYPVEDDRTIVTVDLPSPVAAAFLKLVSDTTLASTTPVFVAELQASEERVAGDDVVSLTRTTKSFQTQFSTTVRVTDRWSISYSLRRSENQQDAGDTIQLNQTLSSLYTLNEKVGFSFGVSDNDYDADNAADRHNRSYSVSMSAQPLASMNFSLGYTHTESDSTDGRDTRTDSISSTLNTVIYPDLTASLSSFWSRTEDKTEGTENSNYGVTLNSTAYLTPRLDLNTTINYVESDADNGDDSRTARYSLLLGYRPSDILLLNASYSGDFEEDESSLRGNSNFLWSKKLQTQFGFALDFGDDTQQQYNALLSWVISHSLSLLSAGNYLTADDGDSWDINVSLNLVF